MFIYKMSEVSRFSSSYNTNMSEEQRIFSIIDNHGAYLSIHKYKQERWFIFTCKRYDDKHCWKNFHHGKNDSIEENSSGSSKYKPFKNPRLYFWNIVLYILRVLWKGNALNSYTKLNSERSLNFSKNVSGGLIQFVFSWNVSWKMILFLLYGTFQEIKCSL